MKAAVLRRYHAPLELVEVPDPVPGPGQVVVDVKACGVCGSDLFLQKGGFDSVLPIIPGHEAAGVVSMVGSGVTGIEPGQLVALYYIEHCGSCRWCRAERPNICVRVRRMGVEFNGGFAERVVVPAANVIGVATDITPESLAVLTDAVATPYHALTRVARAQPGETVVVLGVGGIGSNAVQVAKHLGCHVIAVGRSRYKLELAEQLGADTVLENSEDLARQVAAATSVGGPDIVVQTVGSAAVDQQALGLVGQGGRVVLIGSSTDAFGARSVDLIWREASLHGSRGFTPDGIREVVALWEAGALTTDHLTTTRRPLSEVNVAFDDLRGGDVLRSVIVL